MDKGFLESPAIINRNLFARKLKDREPDAILNQWQQFDFQTIDDFYNNVFALIPEVRLSGVGLELGAGTGALSSTVCKKFENVHTIYAVEAVEEVVRLLQPKIMSSICGKRATKIKRVVGSFDALELDAASVDFCVEIDSLHHSNDLGATLKEVARVMKPNGVLVILDRSHNNRLNEEQRKFMLDVEYSEEWLEEQGFDSSRRLTRRDNGEHEIRVGEWKEALRESGFSIEKRFELRTVGFRRLLRGLMRSVPFRWRKRLNLSPSRAMPHDGEMFWMFAYLMGVGRANGHYRPALRDHTLFVARR